MKKFLYRIILTCIPFLIFLVSGILLPTTPRASESHLMGKIYKDSLLRFTPSPRIILVSGSSISFGINSQIIKDSLKINPINTGIDGGIGLKFMLDNTLEFVKNQDIIIIAPAYPLYYDDLNAGSDALLRTILDIDIKEVKHLNIFQLFNILKYLPEYSFSKLKVNHYFYEWVDDSKPFLVSSFNQYGDAVGHWNLKNREFDPWDTINEEFNHEIIDYIEKFDLEVKKRGARFFVSFPGIHKTSFYKSFRAIKKVENELLKSSITVIGSPERYILADSLFFDNAYHPSKKGADLRTTLLIEDIKEVLSINN